MSRIDEEWKDFASNVLPAEPAAEQVDEMRMSFTAGWFAALVQTMERVDVRGLDYSTWKAMYAEAHAAMEVEKERLERRDAGEAGPR